MQEEPKQERTSVVSAGVRRIRTGLSDAGTAATHSLAGLRRGKGTPGPAGEPEPDRASVADEVVRFRSGLSDARVAASRTLQQVGWARVIIVAVVQLVAALIAWRVWVWRDRRRRRRVQLWIDSVLKDRPRPPGLWRSRRRIRR